jgi:hypothetical protein
MDVTFLHGFNRSDGINQLIAGFGNDINRFESGTMTWTGFSQPISSTLRGSTATFLDATFWTNGGQNNKRYNGLVWTDEVLTKKAPLAKYCFADPNLTRIYLGNISYNGRSYASRVWYTDLPKDDDVTYGLEYGVDLVQYAGGATVKSNSAYFVTRNVKTGDPFIISSGANVGEYRIASVDNESEVTLTRPLTAAAINSEYWCGSNFFDVVTNNNDVITGFGDNSDQLLVFKRNSLYRRSTSQTRKIKGAPGTTSFQSIVNIKDHTHYFHDTGIWRFNGINSELISRPIQDYIEGIDTDNYPKIVAWKVGETLRVFVGNVVNTAKGINVENCILDFDTITETWSPGSLPIFITASTTFLEDNVEYIYLGSDEGKVYLENTGTSDDGTPIPWMMDTGFHFPAGPEILVEFTRMIVYTENGRGIPVSYKLYGTPEVDEKQSSGLGDIENQITELEFKQEREEEVLGRGISVQLGIASTVDPPIIERIDLFYKPIMIRNL